MDGLPEPSLQCARVFRRESRGKHALLTFHERRCDTYDLFGCFARAEDDFRKILPQRPMRVHLRKTQIRQWCRLKGVQDLVATDSARAEFLQQLNRFGSRHSGTVPRKQKPVTPKRGGG